MTGSPIADFLLGTLGLLTLMCLHELWVDERCYRRTGLTYHIYDRGVCRCGKMKPERFRIY